MDEGTVTDLKQFISATFKQETVELKQAITKHIENQLDRLDRKIDSLSAAVADAIDNANEDTEARLKNHERRIKRLEKKTA
ncbi:MAG TPA: hypothetical protein VLH84_04880 [Patescibacteria group bacterium]|nr:hypothetical protein [Patescibacteria group bacterium]